MRYVSLFSGIEAASVAWGPLGWEPVAFAEIEPFPSAVLAHRFPDVPNLGDITQVDWSAYAGVDVLVGGSPCQSFSVAGLRKGLADPRGNLALEYLRAVASIRPRYVVWENVPGVLSADGGRAFGTFLGGLVQLGYGFAYRVLDAQYVRVQSHARAVPQRRRRVFVVGCLGDWRRAAAVLLERESLRGYPAPRREAGEGLASDPALCVAGSMPSRSTGGGGGPGAGTDEAAAGYLIPTVAFAENQRGELRTSDVALSLSCAGGKPSSGYPAVAVAMRGRDDGADIELGEDVVFALRASQGGSDKPMCMASAQANAEIVSDGSPSLTCTHDGPPILAFTCKDYGQDTGSVAPTLRSMNDNGVPNGGGQVAIASGYHVRRLTPTECEALQGFPRGWTDVPYRGKPAADGPRYKAIGNSMACNVMAWIGERIAAVPA
jgi:DNA (cytosine-5)-methyltransferase 1